MAEKVLSASMSFTGWSFKNWFLGNWSTIKEVVKVGAPFLVAWLTVSNPILMGVITIAGKFVLDVGEYFFKLYTEPGTAKK